MTNIQIFTTEQNDMLTLIRILLSFIKIKLFNKHIPAVINTEHFKSYELCTIVVFFRYYHYK